MEELLQQVRDIVADSGSLKIVSTLNENGTIHSAPKGSLKVNEAGQLEYVEVLESSSSYKNVVRSLWFDKKVTVLVIGVDKRSYEITGNIKRILTSGRHFENAYKAILEKRGFGIAAVIQIDVESVADLDISKGIERQKREHFFFTHLDRLAVQE
ncbi:MAG: hypothetical protein FWF67_04680 [Fibromonadales bacterium]|nr:hypothetical protein [Fibromonadales bacterium]